MRRSHGLSAESEVPGLSSRVRRAASSLQKQSEETVVASHATTKTAILTMLAHSMRVEKWSRQCAPPLGPA